MKKIFFVLFLALLWACSDDDEKISNKKDFTLLQLNEYAPFHVPVLEWGVMPTYVNISKHDDFKIEVDTALQQHFYNRDIANNRYFYDHYVQHVDTNANYSVFYFFDGQNGLNAVHVVYGQDVYDKEQVQRTAIYMERLYEAPTYTQQSSLQKLRYWQIGDANIDVKDFEEMILSIGFYNPAAIVE